jgi:hypothetical protein
MALEDVALCLRWLLRQAGGATPAPTSAGDTKIDVGGFAYGNATEYYLRDIVRPGST